MAAGRFVADQVAALQATGRVRPRVVAWENVPVFGDQALRAHQSDAARAILARGRAAHPDPFAPRGAFGPAGVPVARLAALAGETPGSGPEHRVTHRWEALEPLLAALATSPPALVHGHAGYPAGAVAARAAERLRVPFILTEHATFLAELLAEPVSAAAYAETVRRARRVIAVSSVLARQITAALPEAEPRVVVIPNTVAVDDFQPAGAAARGPGELLYVGYRRASKGIATLLTAFELARRADPSLTLRLIGRSTSVAEEDGWIQLASELGIADAVRFEPPADRSGVASAMARATLFVHPSTVETFGVVAAEALAAGLPVVATDSGGIRDVLGDEPERLGALVPHSQPEVLAAAILRTLDRRASFDPQALHDHVAGRFGAGVVAGRILDLYEDVLAEDVGPQDAARPRPRSTRASTADPPLASSRVGGVSGSLVLVGFLRPQLDVLLASLPAELRARLAVVSTGDAPQPPGVRRAVLAPPGTAARLTRLIRWNATRRPGPLGALRSLVSGVLHGLRRSRARHEARVLATLRETILEALSGEPDVPLVIAAGGIDHLALAGIPEHRFRAAAGGIAWLGDRLWDGQPDDQVVADPGALDDDPGAPSSEA